MIDLFAWLCRPFFGPKEKANSQEPNPRHRALGAGYFIFLILIAASVIVLLLSTRSYIASPPEEGKKANEYVYINTEGKQGSAAICAEGSDDCSSAQASSDKNQTPEQKFNEYSKNKRDVNAQEGMWRAANLLVVLTLVQVFVGGFTVYFLVMTFRTQRSELGQAKRSADAAERAEKPYVFFTLECEFTEEKDKVFRKGLSSEIQIFARIKNYGNSPATKLSYDFQLDATDKPSQKYAFEGGGDSRQEFILGAGESYTSVLPKIEIMDYWYEFETERNYVVSCSFRYSDASGELVESGKTISFGVHPTATMEMFEWLKIHVSELTQTERKKKAEANDKYRAEQSRRS